MKLRDRVAIITGAGSGIGAATARLFATEGASVAVVDVDGGAAEKVAAELAPIAPRVMAVKCDMAREDEVAEMVANVNENLGAPSILYNNAGIEGESAFVADMPSAAFDRVVAVNLRGVFLGMKYVLPLMVARRNGSIINQASVAGMVAIRGAGAYCAAKAGVMALTRVAALEYARYGIRVNCICPGGVETPMARRVRGGRDANPDEIKRISFLGRLAEPDEIARMALFLASEDSSFATGAPFVVDGGWTAR